MGQPNFINEKGKKYGKLTVVRRDQNTVYGTANWFCRCECGGTIVCRGTDLRNGTKTHCGCEIKPKKITNYFKIKNMSVHEMAEWLEMTDCELCPIRRKCKSKNCQKEFRQWLLQEVAE